MALSALDYEEIRQLLARYNFAIDLGDVTGWVSCFTEDGIFRVTGVSEKSPLGGTRQGPDALGAYARAHFAANKGRARHWTSNLVIEPATADGEDVAVTMRCYLNAYQVGTGTEPKLRVTGIYEDDLRRVAGRWLFAQRHVTVDGPTHAGRTHAFGLPHLVSALDSRTARMAKTKVEIPRAAVASIFRPSGDPSRHDAELLFIERAQKHGDPWSGHMAFPGGRFDLRDADSNATAERETWEEVGLDLSAATRIGRLDDLDGGKAARRLITVSAHAYWLPGDTPTLAPNHEVADVVWLHLADLLDPARHVDYDYPASPGQTFPAISVDDGHRVIWGLTYRILQDLFARLELSFPRPSRIGGPLR